MWEQPPFPRRFRRDCALPRALRGPVDFQALRRLAAILAGEDTRGLTKDMATPNKPRS